MEIKPIEWRIVEEGLYWMKRGEAEPLLNNYSAEQLKEMEVNLYRLWSRVKRITEMNGVNKLPAVKGVLGEMSSYAAMVEGLLDAQISNCSIIGKEFVEPARQPLYAAIALQSEVYPKLLNLLRELCGGGLIQLPSSTADFIDFNRCKIYQQHRSNLWGAVF